MRQNDPSPGERNGVRKEIFRHLRHDIYTLEKLAQLTVTEGASCDLEIGAITEMATFRPNSPAVLFDSIRGYKKGFRILTNFLAHKSRQRLIYNIAEDLSDSEAVRYWKDKLKEFKPLEPCQGNNGHMKKNVLI